MLVQLSLYPFRSTWFPAGASLALPIASTNASAIKDTTPGRMRITANSLTGSSKRSGWCRALQLTMAQTSNADNVP